MTKPPSPTHERQSSDGSHVKLTWFDNGANAVVNIVRPEKKEGVAYRMSRAEAETLRSLLPANQPD